MATEHVLHMIGGDGETSYANNSTTQKRVMFRVRPILEESIKKMMQYYWSSINPPSCLKVADLGCSSGPNALLFVSNTIDTVHETCSQLNLDTPSFQFFMNDLFGNDFNTIFKSLPLFYHTLTLKLKQHNNNNNNKSLDNDHPTHTCFINATPGTFYGRLFPSNSIHFFHSSFSLHWVSQVTADEKWDIETNKNPTWCVEQFKKDLKVLLRSRSLELVPGGRMLLTFIGRYDDHTSQAITPVEFVYTVLADMVSQKLIEKEKVESFGMPVCHPTAEEVREIIMEEGSFSVERLESIRTYWDGSFLDDDEDGDDDERAKVIAKLSRSLFEPLLKAHFGEAIIDEFFQKCHNKLLQLLHKLHYPCLVISLTS